MRVHVLSFFSGEQYDIQAIHLRSALHNLIKRRKKCVIYGEYSMNYTLNLEERIVLKSLQKEVDPLPATSIADMT